MYKRFLALVLVVYGVFGTGWLDLLDRPLPDPKPPAKILTIQTPSEIVQKRVEIFANLISDPTDKAKIAIFNYDFAQRVVNYETTAQQVNDVYSLAGKMFFNNTLVDRYEGLSEEIVLLLKECMTDENHVLTQDEKQKLNEYFTGVAWILIQKG